MPKDVKQVRFSRRDFLHWSASVAGSLILMPVLQACQRLGLTEAPATPTDLPIRTDNVKNTATPVVTISPQSSPTVAAGLAPIAFVRTRDRLQGVRRALSLLGQNPVAGKRVLLKPNLNSADPAPASTHPDTLSIHHLHLGSRPTRHFRAGL